MTESQFYKKAEIFWANVAPTLDGVLGGYGHISDTDVKGSIEFLNNILNTENPPATKLALDCGAGIGRVSKYVLAPKFDEIDVVEQDEKFINTIKQFMGEDNTKIGTLYKVGLQNYEPEKTYDLIWCQWVLGHLKDRDLIDFYERCSASLNPNGVIVVKENISEIELEYDEVDSSVTRPLSLMKVLFEEAGLKILLTEIQEGFPFCLYPVHSFALIPED